MNDLHYLDVLLDTAKNVLAEIRGTTSDLEVTFFDDIVVVDDGAECWAADIDEYIMAAETVVKKVVEDQYHEYSDWYDELCRVCKPKYASAGGTDLAAFCEEMQYSHFEPIFTKLGLDSENLPAMMMAVKHQGDLFSGNSCYDNALKWLDYFDSPGEAENWMDIGFWNADIVNELLLADWDCEMAYDRAAELDHAQFDSIYSLCNNDLDIDMFLGRTHDE